MGDNPYNPPRLECEKTGRTFDLGINSGISLLRLPAIQRAEPQSEYLTVGDPCKRETLAYCTPFTDSAVRITVPTCKDTAQGRTNGKNNYDGKVWTPDGLAPAIAANNPADKLDVILQEIKDTLQQYSKD
ncbi:hypothetical protein NDU88_005711 [Pleurodeles waltl]|uniref:Uncharacterized protein n=1 Tax=Pleurodeles waltl TaxID=8319 RepID=A0AAV7TUQ4_PLEWA|nr:hypothetical protein NDU88_005711 [Pleurodeles waltl]